MKKIIHRAKEKFLKKRAFSITNYWSNRREQRNSLIYFKEVKLPNLHTLLSKYVKLFLITLIELLSREHSKEGFFFPP